MKQFATIFALVLALTSLGACGGSGQQTKAGSTAGAKAAAGTAQAPESAAGDARGTGAPKLPLMDNQAFNARVTFAADPTGATSYYLTEGSASAGRVKVRFANPQSVPHNVAIEAPNGETIAETKPIAEGMNSITVVLRPGVYHIYSSVPGDRRAGMEGHLTVR